MRNQGRDQGRDPTPELPRNAAVVASTVTMVAVGGLAWWGWRASGPMGGLMGVLAGVAIGALAFTLARAFTTFGRFSERAAPDVRELPPEQAIQVLSAMMTASGSEGTRGGPDVSGGLLGDIRDARTRAEGGDLDGALSKLRGLCEEHARSPAAPAAIARLLAGKAEHARERRESASRALGLALHGGMNRHAAQLLEDIEESDHEHLALDAEQWRQLSRVLAARGDPERAASCDSRADLLDPAQPDA